MRSAAPQLRQFLCVIEKLQGGSLTSCGARGLAPATLATRVGRPGHRQATSQGGGCGQALAGKEVSSRTIDPWIGTTMIRTASLLFALGLVGTAAGPHLPAPLPMKEPGVPLELRQAQLAPTHA